MKHHFPCQGFLVLIMAATFKFSTIFLRTAHGFVVQQRPQHHHHYLASSSIRLLATTTTPEELTDDDKGYLKLAIEHARNGLGRTFPNPAVGCVIVRDNKEVLGTGFHPKAGMPHAEVFALLEASGHLYDGVAAAQSVVTDDNDDDDSLLLRQKVSKLTELYLTDGGPDELFESLNTNTDDATTTTTAYVTLEPCCHYGQTPPCAVSLTKATMIDRVVVGFRDPNPRVDGGGFRALEDAGITVVEATGTLQEECANLVKNFVKRITPTNDSITMTGSKRRALRALAGRLKAEQSLVEVQWSSRNSQNTAKQKVGDDLEDAVSQLVLDPSWMETIDNLLWDHELVLLRLKNAVDKKKGAKLLGTRIADVLVNTHVAQVVGHTALLYRPNSSSAEVVVPNSVVVEEVEE